MPSLSGSGSRSNYAIDVLRGITLNADGFIYVDEDFASQQEIQILLSISGPVTGTSPTFQIKIEDVDQGGTPFNPDLSPILTGVTTPATFKHIALTTRQKISWTLTGGSPVFSGVYLSIFGSLVTSATVSPVGHITVDQGVAGTDPWVVTVAGGTLTITDEHPGVSAHTVVSASPTSVTILASNTFRRQAVIHNNSNGFLYLMYGTPASLSSFTWRLGPNSSQEMPQPVYTGIITGIWSAGSGGDAQVTEITP